MRDLRPPTDAPWGFIFPRASEFAGYADRGMAIPACHPTQIYEALAYLLVFALCMYLYWVRDAARRYSGLYPRLLPDGRLRLPLLRREHQDVQEAWEVNMVGQLWGSIWGNCLASPSSWQASRSSSTPTAIRSVLSPLTKREANNIEALPES